MARYDELSRNLGQGGFVVDLQRRSWVLRQLKLGLQPSCGRERRRNPCLRVMNDLVSLPPGIKPEDIPIPSRGFSRVLFAIQALSSSAESTPLDSSLLRVQKYLTYPGLDKPDVIIVEQNRGFVTVLDLDRDLLFPGPPDLPVELNDMPSCVCYKVEHLFSTVFGVLDVNKDTVMDWRQYWNEFQRLLAKVNPLWKTEVTINNIRDLVHQCSFELP
ncbi:uncharacterized protein BDZ83DRAFT_656960 [Colletotrichum acutatum]|uniref:Uncharacterized protein n=1 Tax=Glomerella acutata TaxID=27357 RepID=A0AAD8U7L3_GLOAC|nr:uncharacterized protein BDZ83DRAFT_656960 [Colletotrichum acutatum]KAK1710906.1 hypothetical protein BDZ83DRAFT_656960 [Colletotrichum acutatum]